MVVVQAIRSSRALLSYFDKIIEEYKKYLMGMNDRKLSIRFVKRSASKVLSSEVKMFFNRLYLEGAQPKFMNDQ